MTADDLTRADAMLARYLRKYPHKAEVIESGQSLSAEARAAWLGGCMYALSLIVPEDDENLAGDLCTAAAICCAIYLRYLDPNRNGATL